MEIKFFPSKTYIVNTYRVTNFLPKLLDMLLFSTEKTEFPFLVFPYFRVMPSICLETIYTHIFVLWAKVCACTCLNLNKPRAQDDLFCMAIALTLNLSACKEIQAQNEANTSNSSQLQSRSTDSFTDMDSLTDQSRSHCSRNIWLL